MKRQYDAFTDEELIEQLRGRGDSVVMDFLMEKYNIFVRKKVKCCLLLLAGILMICRKE
ncbi:MAG: hypothetical protein ACLTDV_13335 [Eubacterium sp.]